MINHFQFLGGKIRVKYFRLFFLKSIDLPTMFNVEKIRLIKAWQEIYNGE